MAATAGAAAASAGPDAHTTPAQGDMPVFGDKQRGQPRGAAVDCHLKGSVDTQTRLCDNLSVKSEENLYVMFNADFVYVKPLLDNLPDDISSEEKRCQAALFLTQIVGRYVYDTCGKSSRRFIFASE